MSKHILRRSRLTVGGLALCLLLAAVSAFAANYPSWWITRGVVAPSAGVTNDFSAANQGELKWFATTAKDELDAKLPGGSGTNVANLVAQFSSTNNYLPVNLGQLKYIAKPFYDRLIAVGYTNTYPWTTNTVADDRDFAMVNLGQLKNVFNFDLTNFPFAASNPGTSSNHDHRPDRFGWWRLQRRTVGR